MTVEWGDLLGYATGLIVFGGALSALHKYMFRPLFLMMSRANDFLDDWFGAPERDGVPARKGVMARLGEIEVTKADRSELADLVAAIADKADREEVLALRSALDDHIRRLDELQAG